MVRRFFTIAMVFVNVSFAITGGPAQPEYAGFTPAEKTGMVDLYTGDFSYSIPLLTVPGPSFNYPLTLGYKAGITTDQASTWVGLGWSLNAGAINRTLDKYPDDYVKGKSVSVLEGENAVFARDIGISYMGIGMTVGTRTDHGWHGSLDISEGGFSLASISYDQKDGFGITPGTNLAENLGSMVQDQAMSAALSGINEGKLVESKDGEGLVESQGLGLSVSPTGHGLSVSVGGFGFSSSSVSVGSFHNVSHGLSIPVWNTGIFVRVGNSTTWIYKKEDVELYGYMNLSGFPKELQGEDDGKVWQTKNSKMEYSWAPDLSLSETNGNSFDSWFKGLLFKQKAFVLPNPDGYQALSEGMSMSFRPYHQDIGDYYGQESIEAEVNWVMLQVNSTLLEALPVFKRITKEQKEAFDRNLGELATLFVDQTNASTVAPNVPLPGFPNDQVNSHQSTDYFKLYDSDRGYPMVPFREAGTPGGAFLAENWRPKRDRGTDGKPKCAGSGYGCDLDTRHRTNDVDDASVLNASTDSYKTPYFDGPSSGGQFPDRISGGNGVFPLFKNAYDVSGVDPTFCPNGVDIGIPQCDPAVPLKALIGFTVVRPDGMVYEYHRPVFNWGQKTISADRPPKEQQKQYDFGTFNTSNSLDRAYATSWLLTAIKGPDYVDLGTPGVDDNDIGSWTRFDYQNRIRGFDWRTPFEGLNPLGVGKDQVSTDDDKSLRFTSYGQASWGSKEVYFLKSIRTPSHEAKFITDVKDDGKEATISDIGSFEDVSDLSKIAMWNMDPEVGDVLRVSYKPTMVPNTTGDGLHLCSDVAAKEFTVLAVSASADLPTNTNNGDRALHRVTLDDEVDQSSCYPIFALEDKLVVNLVSRASPNAHMLRKLNRVELVKRDNPTKVLTAVNFTYETDPTKQLAPGVPNVQTFDPVHPEGKLTLRQVEIGNGSVHLPPYKFTYYMEGAQAPYHRMHWDRWGFYKHDGGLVNTQFVKNQIVDWQLLLDVLNGTATGTIPAFAQGKLKDALRPELDASKFDALVALTSESQLREGQKSALVKAVNRMKNSLTLYSSCPTDIPRADKFPSSSKTNDWASQALADGIIDADGAVLKTTPSAEEINAIQGLNMSLMQEYLFKEAAPSTRSVFFRDLESNHFDHDTDPDDVKAWSLKQVTLPSGGKVDVEYESDDYAYLGRTRALDLVDVDGFMKNGSLDYLKNIGIEKSVYNSTSFLKVDEGLLGDSYWENPDKVELRVSSLFHVYRKNKGTGIWELTPEFAKLQEWMTDGKIGNDYTTVPSEYKIHLTGLYNSSKVNQGVMQASDCGMVYLKDQNNATVDMRAILAPFDLGTVVKQFQIKDGESQAWKEANCCQTNYVDFKLSDLNFANLESKLKDANCTDIRDKQKEFLKGLNYLTLAWGRRREQDPSATGYNADWPKYLPLEASDKYVKMYAGDLVDPSTLPASTPSLLVSSTCSNPSADKNLRTDGCTITYEKDGKWIGPGSWSILEEFSPIAVATPGSGGLSVASQDDWAFMSFNIGKRVKSGDPVAMAAGIPGGGLRVKRIAYNSGWPQRPGEPPQAQVTEYSYDCAGAKGGVYSSGATASVPPPYNNKGDDRIPVPPQISLVQGQPSVGYRRVTEVRPGRGKIVYDFLTPADISDFISYENCNSANIDADGNFLGTQAGCYDADQTEDWSVTPHARFKLHRLSQFQGLLTAKTKLREKKADGTEDTVAQQKYRFLTSLSKNDLGQLYLTSLLNNSDAVGMNGVLESSENIPLQAGGRDYQFVAHPTSAHMGESVERLRLRWYYAQNPDVAVPPLPVRSLIGLNEMEIVEHSIRQVESIDKVDGVGTKTVHAYFDFMTGEPVVSEISALKAGEQVDASIPTKTVVTVPAHWVSEYNPTGSGSASQLSMGSVYDDPKFFDFATGNILYGESVASLMKKKNMLTQIFSQSTYSGLPHFCAEGSADCTFTRSLLAGTNILNRTVTTWALADQDASSGSAWRKEESFNLKLPMDKATRKVVVDRGAIGSPVPTTGVEDDVRSNAAYVLNSKVLKYGDLGEEREVSDAFDVRVSSFYQNHKYLVGQVLNSDLASCAVLSMDELTSATPFWEYSGSLVTDVARSGEKSLKLTAGGSLTLFLPLVKAGKHYEFSIWSKDPAHAGTYKVNTDGTFPNSGALSYAANDAEWQRTLVSVDLTSKTGTVDLVIEVKATGGSLWLDDARFAPTDAQVYSMTYDNRTYKSSMSDPNDNLTRFQYDAFGRLVETRDHQGILLSTQAQMEAK